MFKKLFLFFSLIVLFSPCYKIHAALLINEVMYDLSGSDSANSKSREWLEIYNNGLTDVNIDASTWRIYDGSANRTINGEVNFSIPGGAFIVLAGDKDTYLADNPNFSGVVYDTGITTMSNSGATLKIIDQDGIAIDSFTYTSSMGGTGDGNSLQKISGSWSGAIPTPGITNEINNTPPVSNPTSGSLGSASVTTNNNVEDLKQSNIKKEQKIQTKISSKNTIFSGIPLELRASATGRYGENLAYGKYFWNFGDGDSKEFKVGEVEKFTHIYFYPGEYPVLLEYCGTYCINEPDAFDRILIKVVRPEMVISNVGEGQDFFIELENKGDYEADISRWVLSSKRKEFVFPRNTTLGSKKKMRISPNITGFLLADKESLILMNSQRELVYDYMSFSNQEKNILAEVKYNTEKQIKQAIVFDEKSQPEEINYEIESKNLSAGTIIAENSENNYRPYLLFGVFVVFVGLASFSVYFIRKKRTEGVPGDDFELIDE